MIQANLFEIEREKKGWENEWVGMPEYSQNKVKKEYASIIVRFDSKEDLEEFSKLLNQKLTNKTKSIYFPQIIRGINANKLYIDENEISDIRNK
jgi:hypothetical protein